MTYGRFEDLPVWQAAIELGHRVFDLVESPLFDGMGDLRNQLQRSVLSASNNIAEGFERGTTEELITFLYIARGSTGEVRSALWFGQGRLKLQQLKSQIASIIQLSDSVSRQLRAWANSLQNSDIKGQRKLNDQSKADYDQRRRSAEFVEKLQEIRNRAAAEKGTNGNEPQTGNAAETEGPQT